MLINLFLNKLKKALLLDRPFSQERIIHSYRCISWILTSVVYLSIKPYFVLVYKLGVIFSLCVFSIFISGLYIKFKDNKQTLRRLVLIETVGIGFILFPTGGLVSPFIWYALNPILVAANYLTSYFSWVNLLFYLTVGTLMSYSIFNPAELSVLQIALNNSNIILVFILINIAMQLLTKLSKELQKSNLEKEESMEHIMNLYQIIEAFNNNSSKEKLFEILCAYTTKLTKSDLTLFWLKDYELLKTSKELTKLDKEEMIMELDKLKFKGYKDKQIIKLLGEKFIAVPIKSTSTYFGIVAIIINENSNQNNMINNIKLLEFISELSNVILGRFNQESIEEHLLVVEEQNRIANEIHDSVSQRLFSISYGMHGLIGSIDEITNEEIKECLIEMKDSSNLAMQELRKSIYKLSSRKKGERYLQCTIKSFLDSISKLQNVNTNLQIKGDENILSYELKKSITRIISEACNNAVRHGKCKNININFEFNNEHIQLLIEDDGCGFIYDNQINKNGLGLMNMNYLVKSLNGIIEIMSEVNKGTNINIKVPTQNCYIKQEGNTAV